MNKCGIAPGPSFTYNVSKGGGKKSAQGGVLASKRKSAVLGFGRGASSSSQELKDFFMEA